MPSIDDGVDYVSAPRDYTELFEIYYVYVVRLVRRHGIAEQHKEDVAVEILTRFYERGFLAKFDPELTFDYHGQARPARFKNFLSKFVLTYVQGHRDRQQRLSGREVLLCDKPIKISGGGNAPANQTTWIEKNGDALPSHEDEIIDMLDGDELIASLRNFLAKIPRRSRADTCDLVALFDAVVEQVNQHGDVNVQQLKEVFGVSSTAIYGWMWWLKANLARACSRPLPPKRPRSPNKDKSRDDDKDKDTP